jgi:death-on-curing protein
MVSISVEEVIDIHTLQIEIFGGLAGVKDKRLLESAIMSPQQGYYESEIEVIGAIVYGICQNHPFNDGNKRTAFVVGKYLINQVNKKMMMTNDEYEKLVWDIADNKITKEQLIEIIKNNIK